VQILKLDKLELHRLAEFKILRREPAQREVQSSAFGGEGHTFIPICLHKIDSSQGRSC
jgi:hypothetical protein